MTNWFCTNCHVENGPARSTCWKCQKTKEEVKGKILYEKTRKTDDIIDNKDSDTRKIYSDKIKPMKQIKQLFLIGIMAVMLIMLLYPPFKMVWEGKSLNMGYNFILNPPTNACNVNVELLFMQWLFIGTIGVIGIYILKNKI